MRDYRNADSSQERPDPQSVEQGWPATRIFHIDSRDSRLDGIVRRLRSNGGVLMARFEVDADPATGWFLTRNRLPEAGFFRRFFSHEAVRRHLNDAPMTATDGTDLGFRLESPLAAVARLAQLVSAGGADRGFEGPDSDALVNGFTHAAFGDRYSETSVYVSWEPWSEWFSGMASEDSFFWLDLRTGVATILLVTDND